MCKALEELKQDWKQEGILLGKEEGLLLGKEEGILLGKEEGKAEGIAFEKESNIKTMYKNGFDVALISKALDLDIEYVKSVLSK